MSDTVESFVLLATWHQWALVAQGLSPNTARQYRRSLVRVMADTMLPLQCLTEDDLVSFLADLPPKGQARGQVLRALKSFYGWAQPCGQVEHNPAARIRVPRGFPGPVRALEPAELDRLLVAAERIDPRARAAIELAYATGGRLASICALRACDISEGQVFFREQVKGDRPYAVPLGARARAAIAVLLELADYTPATVHQRRDTLIGVGPGRMWQWVHEAASLAGVDASPHALRRTFGTRLASDPTVDMRTWVELMNHADASQLRRYARASAPRLRAAVEGL